MEQLLHLEQMQLTSKLEESLLQNLTILFFGSGVIGSDQIVASIRRANENNNIDAILIDINSPGGTAGPSQSGRARFQSRPSQP